MTVKERARHAAAELAYPDHGRRPRYGTHGTFSSYVHGCRCDKCRLANRKHQRAYTERKRQQRRAGQ